MIQSLQKIATVGIWKLFPAVINANALYLTVDKRINKNQYYVAYPKASQTN